MSKIETMVWAEKYRPKTVAECILPAATTKMFNTFVETGKIPNLLLSGSAGTGKTTAALALCNQLGYETLMINGSDEGRFLDTVRSKVVPYVSAKSFEGNRKAIIFDEFDYSTNDVMASLRQISDTFSNSAFIYTCNFPSRIIEPIKSRCSNIDFSIPANEKGTLMLNVGKRLVSILRQENIEFDRDTVATILKTHFPDFRRILNECQAASATGTLDATTVNLSSSKDIDELIAILRSLNWSDMRKWVGTQSNLDLGVLSKALYNSTNLFENDSLPQFVLTASEYQYKASFVVDREIHVAAYLTELMTKCNFKKD